MNSGLKARNMSGWDRDSNTLLRIVFENGNSFENQGDVITASAQVFQDGVNVTEDYPASGFNWTIDTEHPAVDAVWNAAHTGMKSVTLAVSDVPDTARLNCLLTSVAPTYGTVQVDVDTMIASCTPGTSTSRLSYSNGLLSAAVEDGENPYTLIDGVLYGKQYLDGTVTASAWVFPHESFDRTVEYQYNHAGLRVQKIFTAGNDVTTTKYTLNGANVVDMTVTNAISDEIVSTDTMHFFYDASNQPAMMNFNGSLYTYVKNLQGDIIGILDNSGSLVVEYYYDAWGKLLYMYGNTIADEIMGQLNPFRYRGYVYDEETELYYLRSRYYSLIWYRFINADSLSQGNAFRYCINSPINRKDENGELSDSIVPIYDTMDAAALAVAEEMLPISLYVRFEYYSLIYMLSDGMETKYSYTPIMVGDPHSVQRRDLDALISNTEKAVGVIHSHIYGDEPSLDDYAVYYDTGLVGYVATPSGIVYRSRIEEFELKKDIGTVLKRELNCMEKACLREEFVERWFKHLPECTYTMKGSTDPGKGICNYLVWPEDNAEGLFRFAMLLRKYS